MRIGHFFDFIWLLRCLASFFSSFDYFSSLSDVGPKFHFLIFDYLFFADFSSIDVDFISRLIASFLSTFFRLRWYFWYHFFDCRHFDIIANYFYAAGLMPAIFHWYAFFRLFRKISSLMPIMWNFSFIFDFHYFHFFHFFFFFSLFLSLLFRWCVMRFRFLTISMIIDVASFLSFFFWFSIRQTFSASDLILPWADFLFIFDDYFR